MTADLTPLVARQKALQRQLVGIALVLVAIGVAVVAFFGLAKGGVTLFFFYGGWSRAIRPLWRKYRDAREELRDATLALETERARLRGSGERRDAAQGLAISEDATGGELSIGQGGELSEKR